MSMCLVFQWWETEVLKNCSQKCLLILDYQSEVPRTWLLVLTLQSVLYIQSSTPVYAGHSASNM